MPIVHVLSPEMIARIAAGEVVERPASVVKELVENALDAGATRLEVHVKDGGKTLIHIRDNGRGIAREDLALLFQRHATSKIATADDLEKVLSLGFRGEALYSIGAVAEVNIKSRLSGVEDAWEMDVNGGVKQAARPAAMPGQGTEMRVKELFFNTPARKKFLKSDAAEMEQILHVVLPYALLYPRHYFTLTHNGRTLLDLSPASAAGRFAAALNLEERHLVAGEKMPSAEGLAVRLILGDINIQRPRRDLQFLFVNGRPVQSRSIFFHIHDIYRMIMPDGANGAFAVFLDIPPEDVDVNIHPAKREVRIRQEARLGGLLRAQAEQLLMSQGGAREIETAFNPGMMNRHVEPPEAVSSWPPEMSSGSQPEAPARAPSSAAARVSEQNMFSGFAARYVEEREDTLKDRLARARLIGTFACTYHLFEDGDSLFVIDQHAAQERILFERFSTQVAAGKVEVQRLLVPLVLKLSPREQVIFEESGERLALFGFEATAAGKDTMAIHTVPVLLSRPESAARALLSDDPALSSDQDALARRACRASVMAGDRMREAEALHQIQALMRCENPFTCPHGRPVFIELRTSFLDRQFMRT
ncbi:MAG: DNA mismatch repair endonuclease MutL [Candidatus Omnitrophota bacterium]